MEFTVRIGTRAIKVLFFSLLFNGLMVTSNTLRIHQPSGTVVPLIKFEGNIRRMQRKNNLKQYLLSPYRPISYFQIVFNLDNNPSWSSSLPVFHRPGERGRSDAFLVTDLGNGIETHQLGILLWPFLWLSLGSHLEFPLLRFPFKACEVNLLLCYFFPLCL